MSLNYRIMIGLIGLVLIFALVSACGQTADNTNTSSDLTATPLAADDERPTSTPVTSASPTSPVPVETTVSEEDPVITLTFWTVEAVSAEAEDGPGDFFANSMRAFERTNRNVEVEVILKKATGKGGVLDFLRTAGKVAPSILPDVAVMQATDLNNAYTDQLIQPLDGRLDRSVVQDLLPAARKMGTVDENLVGVPLGLEMQHTVYNTQIFTAPPILWTDVFSANTTFLFPAKGVNGLVNNAALSQYFSAGGVLKDDQDNPYLDEQVLFKVLDIYRQAITHTAISPTVLDAAQSEELWPTYLEGGVGMVQTSVRQYLTDRDLLNSSTYAAIPTLTETDIPVAITEGWALVLVTDDPARQKAALNLIEWFLSTNNNATWNNLNKSIPTRDTAYQQLAGDDPYWAFLTDQLNTARPKPGFTGYDQLGRIMQQAVQQVISGEATPEEATATAVDVLAQ